MLKSKIATFLSSCTSVLACSTFVIGVLSVVASCSAPIAYGNKQGCKLGNSVTPLFTSVKVEILRSHAVSFQVPETTAGTTEIALRCMPSVYLYDDGVQSVSMKTTWVELSTEGKITF